MFGGSLPTQTSSLSVLHSRSTIGAACTERTQVFWSWELDHRRKTEQFRESSMDLLGFGVEVGGE